MDTTNDAAADTETPIVCTLNDSDAAAQALEWVDLQARATSVVAIDSGVRMVLPADILTEVEDLAGREVACCAFLSIATSVVDDALTLDITSANPDALPVIISLSGLAVP